MMKDYTQSVLQRANEMQRLEAAAMALPQGGMTAFRAGWAAVLAALMALIPSISAAQMMI